jgi:hypothetical protein
MRLWRNDRGLVRRKRSPNPHYKTGWGRMSYVYRTVIICYTILLVKAFKRLAMPMGFLFMAPFIPMLSRFEKTLAQDGKQAEPRTSKAED